MTATKALHVTEAESAILEALWRCGAIPPTRLMAEVKTMRPWGEATIKTLLARLMRKNAVRSARENGLLRYYAMIERSAYVEQEVQDLVDRLFCGDADALSAFLAERAR